MTKTLLILPLVLLLGFTGIAFAQSSENPEYGDSSDYIGALLLSFGYQIPELTVAQQEEFDKRIESLETKWDKKSIERFNEIQPSTPEEMIKLFEELFEGMFGDFVSVSNEFGFFEPTLTESEEKDLTKKLVASMIKSLE